MRVNPRERVEQRRVKRVGFTDELPVTALADELGAGSPHAKGHGSEQAHPGGDVPVGFALGGARTYWLGRGFRCMIAWVTVGPQ